MPSGAWALLRNNLQRICVLLLLAACLAGAFTERFLMYAIGRPYAILWQQRLDLYGWSLPVAKGFGQANKVIFAFILLPVSRNFITYLRATPLGRVIPFDDAVTFHRLLGVLGLLSISGHTLAHIVNMAREVDASREQLWDLANPGEPQPTLAQTCSTQVFLTGVAMWACLLAAYPFALKWPFNTSLVLAFRRTALGRVLNNHNWFYATHHVFVGFYVALLLHPRPVLPHESTEWLVSDTWVWVGLPVAIYIAERLTRGYRNRRWRTQVLSARILPCKVIELCLSVPRGFTFRPGQFILVRCPSVSLFEWHPFSLTCAPADDFLTVHIRAAGDWSTDLFEAFAASLAQRETASADGIAGLPRFPQIIIDGPYGAPTQAFHSYSVLLLIGAGIGVTPMASVLKHLISQRKVLADAGQEENQPQQRIKFYWTIRDTAASYWFQEILEDISKQDKDRRMEACVHITGPGQDPPEANGTGAAQGFLNVGSRRQLMEEGSRVILTRGRVDWESVFDQMQQQCSKATVGVFYCGPPVLGNLLKKLSAAQSGSTRFDFHRESF